MNEEHEPEDVIDSGTRPVAGTGGKGGGSGRWRRARAGAGPGADADADEGPGSAAGPGTGTSRWPQPLIVSVTAMAAIGMLTLAVIVHSSPARAGAGASAPSSAPPTTRGPGPSASTTGTPPTAPPTTSPPAAAPTPTITVTAASAAPSPSAGHTVADAVTALPGSDTGDVAVAVTDLDGDEVAGYDSAAGSDDDTYDTASIVKVDILAALLLREQSAGTRLTERERNLATAMIEASDNDAATTLWDTIGGSAGLDAANDTLGLAHTSGGSGELWGLTQTTAKDQVTLLRTVFGSHSPLSAASRTYIAGLMRSVEPDQRWGVSAADSDDSGYALKNGWLQRSATGRWDINSIGLVTYQGHRLLICVLSAGQHSEAGGIDLVEDVATAAAQAFTAAA